MLAQIKALRELDLARGFIVISGFLPSEKEDHKKKVRDRLHLRFLSD